MKEILNILKEAKNEVIELIPKVDGCTIAICNELEDTLCDKLITINSTIHIKEEYVYNGENYQILRMDIIITTNENNKYVESVEYAYNKDWGSAWVGE